MSHGKQNDLTSRGTGAATHFLPNPNININKMRADIASKIKKALDIAPQDRNWRAFAVAMVDKFQYSPQEIEGFGLEVNKSMGSPTTKLWNHLASRGFKVKDLIHYLDVLGWERLLLDLKPYEPIRVLSQPHEKIRLYVGDSLNLSVTATGFPYPYYQWFRGDDRVPGATESTLSITVVTCADEGTYCCQLRNLADEDEIVYTVGTGVQVRQTAQQGSWPESSLSYLEPYSDQRPAIVNGTHVSNITVSVGEPFTLNCCAVGPEPLEYRWLKNGQHLACLTSCYTTDRAAVVDSGSYQCCVKNQFGEARSQVFQVRVLVESKTATGIPTVQKHKELTRYSAAYNNYSSLDIVAQPKSCATEKGGSVLFTCQAVGEGHISYQWFKDGIPLPGETQDSMSLRMVDSYEKEGVYQCRVWNDSFELLSAGACFHLDLAAQVAQSAGTTTCTATDKIALLIGNYDYIGADTLKAPKTDVLVLAEIFRSMEFKVVSLLNLTLGEMEAAVTEFCSLLGGGAGPDGSGVYGVFYFCGHGIEEIGQCYLVPQDAPTAYSASNCLCAQKVLRQMQEQKPALCTMIVDCCRIKPDNPAEKELKYYPPLATGNAVSLFATTEGMRAYEYDNHIKEPNGVLVKHLQRHLSKRKPVEDIFKSARSDIGADSKVATCQIAESRVNLVRHERSLADPIHYSGHTQVFTARTQRWKNAHLRPLNTSVYIKPLGVTVDVEYQSEFSNVLSIYLTVRDPGQTLHCDAWVVNLPPTLSVMEPHVTVGHFPVRTKTVIHDIQKLKEPLTLTIQLRYRLAGSTQLHCHEYHPIDIGLPLVSTLKLWQDPTSLIGQSRLREPIEQGDDPPYVNMAPNYENLQNHYENFPQAYLS